MDKEYMRQTSPHRTADHPKFIVNRAERLGALGKYRQTYAYKDLMKQYNCGETGVWQILGEDPNCDLGGPHIQPLLCTVEGKFSDVLAYAVTLQRFWTWGSGGTIKKVEWTQVPKKDPYEPIYRYENGQYIEIKGFLWNTITEEVDH
jgi:hypothetical protein